MLPYRAVIARMIGVKTKLPKVLIHFIVTSCLYMLDLDEEVFDVHEPAHAIEGRICEDVPGAASLLHLQILWANPT